MKRNIIPGVAIASRHPLGMKCDTDAVYARFASELADLLERQDVEGFEGSNVKELAIILTMYYEDVLSEIGVWKAFTDKMQELYGRYLPFFDVDEAHYYRDEPNVEDVRFLMWLLISRSEPGSLVSPDTLALKDAAEAVYELMDRRFEEMPVNVQFKEFFSDSQCMDKFFSQRDLMKWFFFSNYLTANPQAMDIVMRQATTFSQNMKCSVNVAMFIAECVSVYEQRVQPLAVRAQEWLAMVLRHNGRDEDADRVAAQRYLPFDFYKVVAAEKGKGMTFESIGGEQFFVSDDDLANPSDECYTCKVVMSAFVEFGGRFILATESSWGKDTKAFDVERENRQASKNLCMDTRKTLIEENDGSPLIYFKDTEALKQFLVNRIGLPARTVAVMKFPEVATSYTVFVSEKDYNISFFPGVERFIKEPRNPYYDSVYAKTNTLGDLFALPGEMVRYLIEHDMMPEANIYCAGGEMAGRKILHDNFDFIARMVMGNAY